MKCIKVLTVALCLVLSGLACGKGYAADLLDHALAHSEAITRALSAADDARTIYERTPKTSPDYGRMEQTWREREYELEEARLRTLARDTRRSEDELRALRRDGRSWEDISRHYNHNHKPDSLGLGKRKYNQYDRHDGPWRDHYKHPPGKAKGHYKGSEHGPPGHYKDKPPDKHKHPDKHPDRNRRPDKHPDKRPDKYKDKPHDKQKGTHKDERDHRR
jgi:hypothetical protein